MRSSTPARTQNQQMTEGSIEYRRLTLNSGADGGVAAVIAVYEISFAGRDIDDASGDSPGLRRR